MALDHAGLCKSFHHGIHCHNSQDLRMLYVPKVMASHPYILSDPQLRAKLNLLLQDPATVTDSESISNKWVITQAVGLKETWNKFVAVLMYQLLSDSNASWCPWELSICCSGPCDSASMTQTASQLAKSLYCCFLSLLSVATSVFLPSLIPAGHEAEWLANPFQWHSLCRYQGSPPKSSEVKSLWSASLHVVTLVSTVFLYYPCEQNGTGCDTLHGRIWNLWGCVGGWVLEVPESVIVVIHGSAMGQQHPWLTLFSLYICRLPLGHTSLQQ